MTFRSCIQINLSSLFAYSIILIAGNSCKQTASSKTSLFQKLNPSETNIHFSNDISYDAKFNIYTYRNFYNGGGVAIGDINNDGLPDIFFSANILPNRLFLNKGNF